jgi:hypothetical protein
VACGSDVVAEVEDEPLSYIRSSIFKFKYRTTNIFIFAFFSFFPHFVEGSGIGLFLSAVSLTAIIHTLNIFCFFERCRACDYFYEFQLFRPRHNHTPRLNPSFEI